MNYYPFHLGDYAAHTAHLEPMEDLAYRRLIDQYYMREGPLPADIQVTAKLVRMRSMVADVESVLKEFFILTPSGWMHNRCEAEIAEMQERQNIAKAKANKRWDMQRTERSNATATENHAAAYATAQKQDAGAMLPNTNTNTNTNKKNTKNTSAIAPPEGVCVSVWVDFVELRKSKKAKLTQTAIDGIRAESVKAGWSMEDALRECCARGWTGFKAEWVAKAAPKMPNGETAYQRSMRERVAEFSPSIARQAPGTYPLENMTLEASNVVAIARY